MSAEWTNRKIKSLIYSLATTVCLGASLGSALAGSCSGNACADIQLQKRADGCMVFHNSGSKQIKIEHHVGGVGIGIAYANSDFVLKAIQGYCMTGFDADYTANYV